MQNLYSSLQALDGEEYYETIQLSEKRFGAIKDIVKMEQLQTTPTFSALKAAAQFLVACMQGIDAIPAGKTNAWRQKAITIAEWVQIYRKNQKDRVETTERPGAYKTVRAARYLLDALHLPHFTEVHYRKKIREKKRATAVSFHEKYNLTSFSDTMSLMDEINEKENPCFKVPVKQVKKKEKN